MSIPRVYSPGNKDVEVIIYALPGNPAKYSLKPRENSKAFSFKTDKRLLDLKREIPRAIITHGPYSVSVWPRVGIGPDYSLIMTLTDGSSTWRLDGSLDPLREYLRGQA